MQLKPNMDLTEFLIAVGKCKGEVIFSTPDGDILNLKSVLSRYVFASAIMHPELLAGGSVICKNQEDIELLNRFILPA